MSQSDAFKKAVVDSKKLTSKPSNEDLLELYGTLINRRSTRPFDPRRSRLACFGHEKSLLTQNGY
jgi:hypothetical protein